MPALEPCSWTLSAIGTFALARTLWTVDWTVGGRHEKELK
jgi:hypothetical protein